MWRFRSGGISLKDPAEHFVELERRYPGKRIFITGAASGLGLAFAKIFAEHGWTLALSDYDGKLLAEALPSLPPSAGKILSYQFDVSNFEEFGKAVDDFVLQFDAVDIAINNAGIGCGGNLHEVSPEIFRRVIEVNLMGVVHGCHHFVRHMKNHRAGQIINVSSAAAFVSAPQMSAYSSSKAAVLALSETLRSELSESGINVSVLMPGFARTNIGINTLGTESGKELARILVAASSLSAEQVVNETLAAIRKQKFYIVLPSEAKFLWCFKRLFPDKFSSFINKELKKRLLKLVSRQTD